MHSRKKHKGCYDLHTRVYKLENIQYNSCIGNYTDYSVSFFTELYFKFEKGILPFKGTIREQPNKIMEIFNLIGYYLDKKRKAKENSKPKGISKYGKR